MFETRPWIRSRLGHEVRTEVTRSECFVMGMRSSASVKGIRQIVYAIRAGRIAEEEGRR